MDEMNMIQKYDAELKTMASVLHQEADGIEKVICRLDEKYGKLIEICMGCNGKVILTGMGKSGHVAKKISATLASLGTSSFYLHPAEAAHGDMGMVQKNDVVIMISKSGETDELLQLIHSFKIIGCKLIGLFCRENSSLGNCCDLSIVIPIEREACINNLAPTTSTTVTMALGDALAVTLSKMKGFSEQKFALYHPQGTLGKQLLTTAGSLIRYGIKETSVERDTSVKEVLWVITKNHFGASAVVESDGTLIGLVTDGDIRRGLEKKADLLQCMVTEIMTSHPVSVQDSMLAVDIFHLMREKRLSVVPVVDGNNKLLSIISIHDIVEHGIVG